MEKDCTIKTSELTKLYKMGDHTVNAIQACNVTINPQEKIAIMGPSGSGKTTLLSLIGGIHKPTSGEISINGIEIAHMNEEALALFRRQNIGFVFQDYRLIPEMTAKQNILLPQKLDGRKLDKDYLNRICHTLKISERLSHLPDQLSGGEKQRIAIARALINKPALLLCDEPTGNLDSASGEEVLSLLLKISDEFSCILIIVTHDEKVAKRMDRMIYIKDGVISEAPLNRA